MDFKINLQKRHSPNIPYVRTHDVPKDVNKSKHCFSAIFQYRTSFIAVLFSISLFVCFVMMMVYVILQSGYFGQNQSEAHVVEKKEPTSSQILLSVDPKMKDAILALATNKEMWSDVYYTEGDIFDTNRSKRQIPQNIPDCRGRQEECKIILDGVRGITKSVHQKMDRLHKSLVQHGILKDTDPKDAKFRKIVECLQCRNAISYHQDDESNGIDAILPGFGRNTDRISELLPFFENHVYTDDSNDAQTSDEERTERVPKTPVPAITKQILESVTNSSKVTSNAKITEILHNTTIVEKEQGEGATNRKMDSSMGTRQYTFNHRPVDVPDTAGREESQVTRNVDATPIILPTAETTKTSQQIQFTPQSNWPSIPVCYYGPPSSSNSYQFKQGPGSSFFIPYGQQQGMSPGMPNQQVKFFYPNGQPMNYPQMTSQQFSPGSPQSSNIPQIPILSPMGPGQQQQQQFSPQGSQHNMPYYCTYVPAPANYQQQQQFPFMSNLNEFQRQFVGKSNNPQAAVNEATKQQHMNSESKSTYDDSDEKYYVTECSGFWCNPPYKKCIAANQRCDGKVDCMGAEDEIDCPYIGYYSRLHQKNSGSSAVGPKQFTIEVYGEGQQNSEASGAAAIDDEWRKTMVTIRPGDGSANYGVLPESIPTNPPPQLPVTDSTDEVETTTFTFTIPVLPPQFACKRIIQTIPFEKRCNNVYDCEDTSDEEDCTCKDYLRWEHPSAICDGHVDCFDGSDEEQCDICKEDQYHCHRSGGCIPKRKRCDLKMDCKLNEDELDCFALTDGHRVNLDLDKRPHLNLEGVLTRYDNGVWHPSCFKPEYRTYAKRMEAGQKICEYLGFKNVDSAEEMLVKTSKLVEKSTSKDSPVNYEYPLHLALAKREANNTCYGFHIRCKPILDRKINVHLKIDPKTKERSYLWPWEASIFVDGKYHCSAVLLENDLLLTSSECSEDLDLHKNYTTALLGVPSPNLPFDSPYQQTSQVVDIKPVKNSDAALFRLKDGINMTRYVQPLYLEKRIFPASKDDTCVAIGVNERHERKMQFLQPVLDNCPKCHRCYIEKGDYSTCSKDNTTTKWSGNVVCLSNGGWYPAAVFQDKDENCGFGNKQVLNSIDYIHAYLSQAIDERVQLFDEPKCEGIRSSLGQCVPWDRVCDGVRDCRDGMDESREHCQKMKERCENDILECKCSKAELRCGDGKCVPKEMFCNGKVDCTDGSDEPANCTCSEYLKLTEPRRVCDGRRHCLDKSDENYQHCLCKDSSFKCSKSVYNNTVPCIPQDFVCDGEVDCPHGEDEMEEVCWSIKPEKIDPKGKGEVMRRDFGVLHSECFPRPIQSQREVTNMCAKLGYKSGLLMDGSKLSDSQYVARNDFYMFQLNNYTWMTMRKDISFGVWVNPEGSCYRLFVHCF